MKIYNEIVFDVDGNVIYEDSYEYSGDVMLCQGDDPYDLNDDGGVNMLDLSTAQARGEDPAVIQKILDIIKAGGREAYEKQETDINKEILAAQKQAGDVQANPLPSVPSISSVGTIAPTGSVNWNAVPGGFQPLPQVAGGRKKLYQISKFHGGQNKMTDPTDISDIECQAAHSINFSHIGRIKALGDGKSLDSGISGIPDLDTAGDNNHPNSGHGWFIFKSPYSLAATPAVGDWTIAVTQDGENTQLSDGTNNVVIDISSADNHVAPVFYAAGNGLYVCDANFDHTRHRRCAILVNRNDEGNTVLKWESSGTAGAYPLIPSPTYDDAAAANMAAGDVKVKEAAETASVAGSMIVACAPAGTGTWDGDYYFYVSWLFDGGVETGLTSAGDDDGTNQPSDVIAFATERLDLDISLVHTPHATNNTELGGHSRIEGARIYFKESGTAERFLLAEFNLIDGVKGALDSTFSPWDENGSDVYSHTTITFVNPPSVYTYASLNGYYANEVYLPSPDINADNAAGPIAISVKYKAAVVGPNGIVYIGNIKFDGEVIPDLMMFSMPGKPGVFPKYNRFDAPSSDGSPIRALAAFKDTILQFKENSLYVINVSNPAQFYAQAVFKDCGVHNQCQVFTASFGVIFANANGCFIYDGGKVISLTSGKLGSDSFGEFPVGDGSTSGKPEVMIGSDTAHAPSVGYDARSEMIVVARNIGHDAVTADEGAWIYHMPTQSWTYYVNFIDNDAGDTISNFIVTPNGYLSHIKYDATNPVETPFTFTAESKDFSDATCDYDDATTITHDDDGGKIEAGMSVTGTGIPNGATVDSITGSDNDEFELSASTTGGAVTNGTLYFTKRHDIRWWSKYFDFGFPSQTKYLYKVYISYKGDGNNLTIKYGVNGETDRVTDDLYSFATDSYGGTADTTPLQEKNSTEERESWHVRTLYPATASEGKDWTSISIFMDGEVDTAFEINDIAILYRLRPIK